MALYTNSTGRDSIRNAFYLHSYGVHEIYTASPFFSYDSLINDLLERDCLIRLIVRLGPATSAGALGKLINNDNVHIRFFTSPFFHSKLYIFGDKVALVGSANLTQAGLQSNCEIAVEVSKEDARFDMLVSLFNSYWNQAEVLTPERLQIYSNICRETNDNLEDSRLERKVKETFGDIIPAERVEVGRKKPKADKIFLESYRRSYQEFLTAYKILEKIYREYGHRQQPEELVPLRIEVDSLFSFIREGFTTGDSYKYQPILHGAEQEAFIKDMLQKWFNQRWDYLDKNIVENIPRIVNRLSKESLIKNATIDEIYDALDVCHSFHDRFRFYRNGHDTMKLEFIRDNDINKIKKCLIYLLHGKSDFITRMGTCIFDDEYKLNHVGRSVIQELLGWVNDKDIPICNGRTVKALRYLGFDVEIFT